jgi:hypothetical protein
MPSFTGPALSGDHSHAECRATGSRAPAHAVSWAGTLALMHSAGKGAVQLASPRFSRYRWWYSMARKKFEKGTISVTAGRR